MTFWDFLWTFWTNDGWLFSFIFILFIAFVKIFNFVKLALLVRHLPDERTRQDMKNTFDELRIANTLARNEIENLHNRVMDTKTLLGELNSDIAELNQRISRSRRLLVEKKKLTSIAKDDLQEVIDVLDGYSDWNSDNK